MILDKQKAKRIIKCSGKANRNSLILSSIKRIREIEISKRRRIRGLQVIPDPPFNMFLPVNMLPLKNIRFPFSQC
jgi:hypothetical protein